LLCKEETNVAKNGVYLLFQKDQAAIVSGGNVKVTKGTMVYRLMQTIEEVNSVAADSVEERLSQLERRVISLEKK
jgi:hypothetical protein